MTEAVKTLVSKPAADAGDVLPLATFAAGQHVRLVAVQGGQALRARLASLGLLPGARLTVVQNSGGGPLVISVHNTRLALGRGMGRRLLVAAGAHRAGR